MSPNLYLAFAAASLMLALMPEKVLRGNDETAAPILAE